MTRITIETLRDIVKWTRRCHDQLSACLTHCAQEDSGTRASMVMEYLAQHEQVISSVIRGFEEFADDGALNTWCRNYLGKDTPRWHRALTCDRPFVNKTVNEVVAMVEEQHREIIELYRGLATWVKTPSAAELVDQLLALEKHETMCMSQNTNRFQDL